MNNNSKSLLYWIIILVLILICIIQYIKSNDDKSPESGNPSKKKTREEIWIEESCASETCKNESTDNNTCINEKCVNEKFKSETCINENSASDVSLNESCVKVRGDWEYSRLPDSEEDITNIDQSTQTDFLIENDKGIKNRYGEIVNYINSRPDLGICKTESQYLLILDMICRKKSIYLDTNNILISVIKTNTKTEDKPIGILKKKYTAEFISLIVYTFFREVQNLNLKFYQHKEHICTEILQNLTNKKDDTDISEEPWVLFLEIFFSRTQISPREYLFFKNSSCETEWYVELVQGLYKNDLLSFLNTDKLYRTRDRLVKFTTLDFLIYVFANIDSELYSQKKLIT